MIENQQLTTAVLFLVITVIVSLMMWGIISVLLRTVPHQDSEYLRRVKPTTGTYVAPVTRPAIELDPDDYPEGETIRQLNEELETLRTAVNKIIRDALYPFSDGMGCNVCKEKTRGMSGLKHTATCPIDKLEEAMGYK